MDKKWLDSIEIYKNQREEAIFKGRERQRDSDRQTESIVDNNDS